jgi:hypothetical protein
MTVHRIAQLTTTALVTVALTAVAVAPAIAQTHV